MLPRLSLDRLAQTRIERGLTRLELAALLGVYPGTIGHWERGTHYPRPLQERELRKWLETPQKGA